jgi:hypothetical protein
MVQLQVQHTHELSAVESKLTNSHLSRTTAPSYSRPVKDELLQELYAQNVTSKIWRVAQRDLKNNVNCNIFLLWER